MYYSSNIDIDSVGLLGNKLFIIAVCKAMNLKIGYEGAFIANWRYDNIFPNLKSDTLQLDNLSNMYIEPKFSYTEIPISEIYHTQLKGYFQSEKYFKEYRKEILEMFEPNDDIKKLCDKTSKEYEGKRITSIHIRLGDYLKFPDVHPTCTIDYYNNTIEILKDDTDIFIVFSDDINIAKTMINGDNVIYSEGRTNVEDMFLMSICDNHIIGNSSFSWWGSYLNKSNTKKTLAPKKWFGYKGPQDFQDIYREDMIVI